jgi:SAM-dependent methyltransferase
MRSTPDSDPVLLSVAAYSNDPDAYAARYAEHRRELPERFTALFAQPSRILDVGCGPGRDLRLFAEAGHSPIGIELNPDFIKMAQIHGEVIAGDIRRLGDFFVPDSFDGVWAQASLVHLSHEETRQVLSDITSLLVPGGHMYVCVPVAGETGWREEEDGMRWYATWPDDSFVESVISAGFTINDVVHGPYVEVWATHEKK